MKQRCPQCESWSAEDATACPCGFAFSMPGFARIHRAPPPSVDPSLINELHMRSRHDTRNGILLICVLLPLQVVASLWAGRTRIVPLGGLLWAVILIIRGRRLRREAWEAQQMAGR